MEKSDVRLFNDNGLNIAMPSTSDDTLKLQEKLMETEVEKALYGEQVKTIVLPEESVIQSPNYVLDFSDYNEITTFQRQALTNLVSSDGDTALYLYNSKSLIRFGMGKSNRLENLMILTKRHIFSDEIKVYRNVERDKPLNELVSKDVTKIRLKL